MRGPSIILFVLALVPAVAVAGEADVLDVKATKSAAGTYDFDVTVRHADTGWDHYADKWDVVAPDGTPCWGRGSCSIPTKASSRSPAVFRGCASRPGSTG